MKTCPTCGAVGDAPCDTDSALAGVVHYRRGLRVVCAAKDGRWRSSQHFASITCADCLKSEAYKTDMARYLAYIG